MSKFALYDLFTSSKLSSLPRFRNSSLLHFVEVLVDIADAVEAKIGQVFHHRALAKIGVPNLQFVWLNLKMFGHELQHRHNVAICSGFGFGMIQNIRLKRMDWTGGQDFPTDMLFSGKGFLAVASSEPTL